VFFGGGVGFISKKLPPLNEDLFIDGAREWPVGDVSPEKGSGLACCCGADENDREPKASPKPPSACAFDCEGEETGGGDCIPPKALTLEAAGCWGGGVGFDAYRDKIDCLRSDRPGAPPVFGPVLDGLAGGADWVPPKKSRPSRLSPGFVCLGAAAGAFGGGGALLVAGSVVLGLAGAGSFMSPNRSTSCGLARGGCGRPPARGALAFLWLAPLVALARSCTTFRGTSSSSPASNVLGSGIGPSMTHRLLSYLVRMKFSIFDSFGTWPSASLLSQYLFARLLPHLIIELSCSSVQESKSTLLTLLMCTPILR